MEIGTEISQKIRSAIKAKLIELGSYVDEELPDYIMVMVANKKTEQQMADDLSLFLGLNTDKFTTWLHGLLSRLQSITSDPGTTGAQKQPPLPSEPAVQTNAQQVTVVAKPLQNIESDKAITSVSSSASPEMEHSKTPESLQSEPVTTVTKSAEPLPPPSSSRGSNATKKVRQKAESEDPNMQKVSLPGRKRKGRSIMSCISVPASSTIHVASKSKVPKIQSPIPGSVASKTDSYCKAAGHCDSTGACSSNLHVNEVDMRDDTAKLDPGESMSLAIKLEPTTPGTKVQSVNPVTKLETATPGTEVKSVNPETKLEPATPGTEVKSVNPVTKLEPTTPGTEVKSVNPVTMLEPATPVTRVTNSRTKVEITTPVTKLELTTPVSKLEPNCLVTKLEPTTPITKLEITTPLPKLETSTPLTKLEQTTHITKMEKTSPVVKLEKATPAERREKRSSHTCSDTIRQTENEVISIASDGSDSKHDAIRSAIQQNSLPDLVSSVSFHSTTIAGNTEPLSEKDTSDGQYTNNSESSKNSNSLILDPNLDAVDDVPHVRDSSEVQINDITPDIIHTNQVIVAQLQPEEVMVEPELNPDAAVVVRRAVIVEERFGIRRKKQDPLIRSVQHEIFPECREVIIEDIHSSQLAQTQSDQPDLTVRVPVTEEPELLVREETDEFNEEFQTETKTVVVSHKSRQRPSHRYQKQGETRHHRRHKHGRESDSRKSSAPAIVTAGKHVTTLAKKNAADNHIPSKSHEYPEASSQETCQTSIDSTNADRQASPVSSIKITRTFGSHTHPVQSIVHRQSVHQRLSGMLPPPARSEKVATKGVHRKKQQMSSVVGTVKQMPNLEPPQEVEEEEYDPYNPAVGNVASVIRVTPRRQLPASLQANKSLLLKAVSEANQSVTSYPPAPPLRKGGVAVGKPIRSQKRAHCLHQQHAVVQEQVYGSALSHRLGITSRSRHKGILDLAHARGEHDPMTSAYEYPIRYQPLTVAVKQQEDDVILIGVEHPDRRIQWNTEDVERVVVDSEGSSEEEEEDNDDHEEGEVVEKRVIKREKDLTDDDDDANEDDDDDDEEDDGEDNGDQDEDGDDNEHDSTDRTNYADRTNVVVAYEKDENVEEEVDEDEDELLLDVPSSSQDEEVVPSEQQHTPGDGGDEEEMGDVEVIFSQADITVSPDETISQDEDASQDEQTQEDPVKSLIERPHVDQSEDVLPNDKPISIHLPHTSESKDGRSKSSGRISRSHSDTAVIRPRIEPLPVRSTVKHVAVPAFQRLGEQPDNRLFIDQDAQDLVVRATHSSRYPRDTGQHVQQQKIQYIQQSPIIESADNYQVIQRVYPHSQYEDSYHQIHSHFPQVQQSQDVHLGLHSQVPVRHHSSQITSSQFAQLSHQRQYLSKPPPHCYQNPLQLSPHEYMLSSPPFVSPAPVSAHVTSYQPVIPLATTNIVADIPRILPEDTKTNTRFVVTLDGVNSADYEEKMEVEYDDDEELVSMTTDPDMKTMTHDSVRRLSPVESVVDMSLNDDGGKNTASSERCRFWPACSSGNTCQFHHPSMPCKTFPNCKFGEKCLYIHPNCKYDATCTRTDCPFTHASKRKSLHSAPLKYIPAPQPVMYPAPPAQPPAGQTKSPVCKFYPKCTNMNCPFSHPKPCRFGFNCANRSTCPYYHASLPKPDKLKWVASSTQSRNKRWSSTDSGDK